MYPFVEKLTTYINILDLQDITDEQVKTLVNRCNKLTELALDSRSITNTTETNIIDHLPTLKKLNLFGKQIISYPAKYPQTQGLIINQDIFNVAAAQELMDLKSCLKYKRNRGKFEKQCKNGIWEIKVKQLQMLPFYQPNFI